VIQILPAKRAKRGLSLTETRREDAIDQRGHGLSEDRTRAFGAAIRKLVNQQARHQQGLESFADTIHKASQHFKRPAASYWCSPNCEQWKQS
jgi:hypothetical protein